MNKILIVGLGSIGRRHTDNFSKHCKNIDIVDINPERIDQAKKEYNIHRAFTNYEEALEKNIYDFVAITTPPHLHLPIAKLSAQKNSHLFIEKPVGMNVDGWDEVAKLCEKNNLISYVAYCHRHINYSNRLKELIDSGIFGRIIHANMRWGSYLPDWHPWEDYRTFYMAKKEQGGGALLDESHGIDLARYILGDIKEVFAVVDTISDLEMTSDDVAFLTLKAESGVLIQINFDLVARAPRCNFEIVGTDGTIIWDRTNSRIEYYTSESEEWVVEDFKTEDTLQMYPNQAKYFIDCIKNNQKPNLDLYDGLKTQKVIDGAFQSSLTGKIIPLS